MLLRLNQFGLFAPLLFLALPLMAHHSASIFDTEREVILQGTVTSLNWTNPHVYLGIETENNTGEITITTVEGPSLTALELVGWSEYSLAPGDSVIIVANPSRNSDSKVVLGNSVLSENGDYLPMGGMRLQEALAGRRSQ